jgi:hypothetical protein
VDANEVESMNESTTDQLFVGSDRIIELDASLNRLTEELQQMKQASDSVPASNTVLRLPAAFDVFLSHFVQGSPETLESLTNASLNLLKTSLQGRDEAAHFLANIDSIIIEEKIKQLTRRHNYGMKAPSKCAVFEDEDKRMLWRYRFVELQRHDYRYTM